MPFPKQKSSIVLEIRNTFIAKLRLKKDNNEFPAKLFQHTTVLIILLFNGFNKPSENGCSKKNPRMNYCSIFLNNQSKLFE